MRKVQKEKDMFSSYLILRMLLQLLRKVNFIMATLQEVNDTLDAVAAGVNGLEAQIADLKAQVAAGSPVSQAQLDDLAAKAAAIGADIADTTDQG
jgi:uncharacterized protein YoxC